jgi:hypothetical protein
MRRSIENLKPFPFESDFSAPRKDDPEQITLSASDLATLLSETRKSTAELVRNDALAEQADTLSNVSGDLKSVMTRIVDLAAYLETAAIDEHDRQQAMENVRRIASTVLEGQGELFSES